MAYGTSLCELSNHRAAAESFRRDLEPRNSLLGHQPYCIPMITDHQAPRIRLPMFLLITIHTNITEDHHGGL
jgi:hypothetical protein